MKSSEYNSLNLRNILSEVLEWVALVAAFIHFFIMDDFATAILLLLLSYSVKSERRIHLFGLMMVRMMEKHPEDYE